MRDLRYAARTLRHSPSLVIIATLSLALGIGINTTLYSVFRTVMLQPPTAAEPERLVRIEPGNGNQMSYPNFQELRLEEAFAGVAAYGRTRVNLRSGDDVEQIGAMLVSPTFFDVLGVQPARGRAFSPADAQTAIVTDAFWRKRFGDAPSFDGAPLTLNGQPFVIIGVLPAGYRAVTGADGPELYLPISALTTPRLGRREDAFLTLVGRLGEGVSRERAGAVATARARDLERVHPEENESFGDPAYLFPISGLGSWRTRDTPATLVVGLAAIPFVIFGLVLLIACANVAALLYARGTARRREIAIRIALGASRNHVVRTVLAESLLLSAAGAGSGLLLTYWLCGLISDLTLPGAGRPVQVAPDATVMVYALGLALATALACGITPAIAATRPGVAEAMKRETARERRRFNIRNLLVGGQVATALVLLFVSALFLRSLAFVASADPGFDLEAILTARIDLPEGGYTDERRLQVAAEAASAVAGVPGVQSVSVTSVIPLGGDVYETSTEVAGADAPRGSAYRMNVGPDYFRTLGMALHGGRDISSQDGPGAPPVAVVNEAFVRANSLASPLGGRVRGNDDEPWMEIVGVVGDSKYASFGEVSQPIVYRSYMQSGGTLNVVARTLGPPAAAIPAARGAILRVDPAAIVRVQTGREATSLEYSLRRLVVQVLGGVGALGLGLALIGVYGVMSQMVNRRTREIGIRMALGASRAVVLRSMLRYGLVVVGAGILLGAGVALAAARTLAFFMSGVTTSDPIAMGGTALLLLMAGLLASYVPARRATRVDPMVALRTE